MQVDINTLNNRFKEVSEQIKKSVVADPAFSSMVSVLLVIFETQSNLIESQSSENERLTKRIEKLTLIIEKLLAKLDNKSISVRKTADENINGKGVTKHLR